MHAAARRMAALPGGELCARVRRGSDSFFGLGSLLAELAWEPNGARRGVDRTYTERWGGD